MTPLLISLACSLFLVASPLALAKVVKYSFNVQTSNFEQLCHREAITTVNGQYPGPTVVANEGDTLIIRVVNSSPHGITIHWHGVKQLLSAWADGPEYVTQCPIHPGKSYAYKFTITGQEGTLFWHAHAGWLRVTVCGAIIIRPKTGSSYPFPTPFREVPIILGEWWNANIIDIEDETITSGGSANVSDALLINGQPGDLYPCSKDNTFKLNVVRGETYLLRIVNAALDTQLFFAIADHTLTVVGTDASYTIPMKTDIIFIAPGQTVDALLAADQKPTSYYMAARAYISAPSSSVDKTTTTAIVAYDNSEPSAPKMPNLPPYNDTQTMHKFSSSLLGLANGPHWVPPPLRVDERMFITMNLGLFPCGGNSTCTGPRGMRYAASLNNESFVTPTKISLLEASYNRTSGIYTTDFQANNPGVWLLHCHLELHVPWGMSMAFEVENGPTPETTLPPPPADLPKC